MERVIKQYLSERGVLVKRESIKGDLISSCPFDDHEDSHASFAINKDSGLFNCFGCGRKGTFEFFYAILQGIDIWTALEEIRSKYGLDLKRDFKITITKRDRENLSEEVKDIRILYNLMKKIDAPPYYLERGFTADDWEHWGGRFDEQRELIVFPVRSFEGNIRSIVGRSIGEEKRYHYYEGSRTKSCLYGMHLSKPSEEVILCEGTFDVHRLWKLVNKGVDADVVSLMSATLSPEQESLLSMWDTITLWLDNDDAGRKAQKQIAKHLLEKGKRVNIVPWFTDGKDQAQKEVHDLCLIACYENRLSYIEALISEVIK